MGNDGRWSEGRAAREIGCAASTLQRRRQLGLMARSVVEDERGRFRYDPKTTVAEFEEHTTQVQFRTAPRSHEQRREPPPPPVEVDAPVVVERLAAVVRAVYEQDRQVVEGLLPAAVEGLAQGLVAAGRAVTEAALLELFRFGEDEDAGMGLACALQAVAGDLDLTTRAEQLEAARAAGRREVSRG